MEAVQLIMELKRYSKEVKEDDRRDLIDISKYVKDGYSLGFAMNKYNTEYEVYMFILCDTKDITVSNLFYQSFKYLDQAKEYFKTLEEKYKNIELEVLLNTLENNE